MAPRSSAFSTTASGIGLASTTIADLPDGTLERCLGFLATTKERQQTALVCKRFAAAACSPELLQDVDVDVLASVPAVHSFAAWLMRQGRCVRRLALRCPQQQGSRALSAALEGCLTAAGVACPLEQLHFSGPINGLPWLPAMQSLQRLRLITRGALPIPPAVSSLTALHSLNLLGHPIEFSPRASLPPSVTWLEMCDRGNHLAQQVTRLPRLARLTLTLCDYSPASMAQLSRLSGSLSQLLIQGGNMHAVFSTLTGLQHLELWHCPLGGLAGTTLEWVLRQLARLTCLVVHGDDFYPPPALGGLSNLQRCYLLRPNQRAAGAVPQQLPSGPWLGSLRWLGASRDTFANSLAVLQAATALEFVEIGDAETAHACDWQSPDAAALFSWLAQHPPLKQVSFEDYLGPHKFDIDSRHFAALLLQLGRRRPGLRLRCSELQADFPDPMWKPLCGVTWQ